MSPSPSRSNGFDGLRLVAASLVIYGHAYPLTGRVGPALLGSYLHAIGVKIFFVVSGYLIAASWRADPDMARFWARRSLRIFPGLILVCLVAVLALGPALTMLSPGEYFRAPATPAYFWNIALYPMFDLPGVFVAGQPLTAVNGALWTLPVEVAMYAGLALLLGPAARPFLRGEEAVTLVLPPAKARRGRRGGAEANPVGDPLFDALRALRRDLAHEAGVPPYVIFHDSTLRELAARRPRSDAELAHIGGIGTRKREVYGQAFLAVIAQFADD